MIFLDYVPKRSLLFWITFRKSYDIFGLGFNSGLNFEL